MKRSTSSRRRPRAAQGASFRAWQLFACAIGILAVVAFLARNRQADPSPPVKPETDHLAEAKRALAAGRFSAAGQSAAAMLAQQPNHAEALLIAGEVASRRDDLPAALAYYQRLPDSDDPDIVLGHCAAADIALHLGEWQRAEQGFRKILRTARDHPLALTRLAYLLTLEGRSRWAIPLRLRLIAQGDSSTDNLAFLADVDRLAPIPPAFLPNNENETEWQALLGMATAALAEHEDERCQMLLDRVLAKSPQCPEALALQGRLLLALSPDRFARWCSQSPTTLRELPEFWHIGGRWLQSRQQFAAAARAFWEAVRRQPEHRGAHDGLAQTLTALGRTEEARGFSERHHQLDEFVSLVARTRVDPQNKDLVRRCAESSEQLGRVWEAYGWCRLGVTIDPGFEWAARTAARLRALLRPGMPQTIDEANPALKSDLSDLPLADWRRLAQAASTEQVAPALVAGSAPALVAGSAAPRAASATAFEEVAQSVGIEFVYQNGHDSHTPGPRLFEFSGGGCAVLDYDGDGLADLHLTQGSAWPPAADQTDYLDRLYRNRKGRAFDDVTRQARIEENRFSQGVAVGDFNQDGFPDLYIANIGGNRLLANQGDGTFADVTEPAGISGDAWTTSCLVADVNGDALPDLYDVNYVMGAGVFDLVCSIGDRPRLCGPKNFEPQPDQLWINLGDGRFADVSRKSGVHVAGGNGLGIVAADFDGGGKLSLFVANDQDANFYFVNQAAERGGPLLLDEQAAVLGLAFDGRGRAQACMGVAAGDANRDGRLDLFVTNFYRESNTLYLAGESGFFTDATAASGLAQPSYERLGFGTQFIDADLDGWEDLVVVNGHIEDRTSDRVPYAMRPQLFVNAGGRFVERSNEAGPYFSRLSLGRALAKIDWNRDGREDLLATHLETPTALLTNVTPDAGHFLAIELRGVTSERDALGAHVRVSAGGESWWRQLTAGDGYQASNERRLVFGLGRHDTAELVTVQWPAGGTEIFHNLPVNACYRIVEGRHEANAVP
ncbi:MAG TPA: FG-GAP-like repeat-containing protein [Pirellulales bacterium]